MGKSRRVQKSQTSERSTREQAGALVNARKKRSYSGHSEALSGMQVLLQVVPLQLEQGDGAEEEQQLSSVFDSSSPFTRQVDGGHSQPLIEPQLHSVVSVWGWAPSMKSWTLLCVVNVSSQGLALDALDPGFVANLRRRPR